MTHTKPTKKDRPLSPHLQIYKPQFSSVTSVLHRATGIALTMGLFIVAWGLVSLASGRESYDLFIEMMGSVLGQIALFVWTAAFFFHLCTGIRHLIRDLGYLYENKDTVWTGYAVIIAAAILTFALWGAIYGGMI